MKAFDGIKVKIVPCILPVIVLLSALAVLESGCGTTLTAGQTNAITVGVDATVCILEHLNEPPATIAETCLNDSSLVSAVTQVIAAHYAAEVREGIAPPGIALDAGQ
jgi:hypothetical protein